MGVIQVLRNAGCGDVLYGDIRRWGFMVEHSNSIALQMGVYISLT